MLRFFRINDPYRLLGLLALLVALGLPFLIDSPSVTLQELKNLVLGEAIANGKRMYVQVLDSTAPLATGIFGAMDLVFGRSALARQLLSLVLIFFQAAFFAILLINNKAYNDSTYVPALVFAVLCFFSFDMLSFSPELLASTVLLFALNNLFKEIEFRSERDEVTLSLGFWLGAASLIIFSYVVFLVATIFILLVFTRPSLRNFLLLLFGFCLPHVMLILLYYFWGELPALWGGYYLPNLTVHGKIWISAGSILLLTAIPIAYFIVSLFMLNREARFTKYQSQLFQVMFLWMIFCVIQVFITRDFSPHSIIIFIPSLAYFISHFLLLIRRKLLAEAILWVFILGLLGLNLLSRYGQIESISYARLFPGTVAPDGPVQKKVMVASPDLGVYHHNKLAGYFLEWDLSKAVLESPDYYENLILVYNSIRTDPPDVIVDPDNLMKKFFDQMPEVRRIYSRNGIYYVKESLHGISSKDH